MSELTPKQRRFVAEYLKDQNGTQAAIRSGYSKKTAQEQSSVMLSKPIIREAVEEKLRKAEQVAIVDRAYVLTKLKKVAERCMQEEPVMEFDHENKEMVEKKTYIEGEDGTLKQVGIYEFDSSGANKSLELLGKSIKLFTDKVEHSGDLVLNLGQQILDGNKDRGVSDPD